MKKHEGYVNKKLERNLDGEAVRELLAYHDKQIQWMQHERLVHLIVTLFVCLFMLLSWGFAIINNSIPTIALAVLLLILSVAYIFHYYRIENRVQKWYLIYREIRAKLKI